MEGLLSTGPTLFRCKTCKYFGTCHYLELVDFSEPVNNLALGSIAVIPLVRFCLFAVFLALAKGAEEEEEKQVEGKRWRQVLSADIQVPVLQVPAGEEGLLGGLPNLLKEEEEKEEDDEEKEGEEKELEGKRRDEEEMQDRLVAEEGIMVNFPLVSIPLVSFLCSFCSSVLSAEKKSNNKIVEMHKDSTSCIISKKTG